MTQWTNIVKKDKMTVSDDLCDLVDDLHLDTPDSSTALSPSESPLPTPRQEPMTTAERLSTLVNMRKSFCERIDWLVPQLDCLMDESAEAEIEELQGLVDGIDVLIQRLEREREKQTKGQK